MDDALSFAITMQQWIYSVKKNGSMFSSGPAFYFVFVFSHCC